MKEDNIKPLLRFKNIFYLLIFGLLFFGLHKIVSVVFEQQVFWGNTVYSLSQLHLFSFVMSVMMSLGVLVFKNLVPNQLGYLFLILLTLKLGLSYWFISPVLNVESVQQFERVNFFIIFMFYLCFDVYVCYSLLNEKK